MGAFNTISIQSVASSVLALLGVEKSDEMAPPIESVVERGKVERVFMYNPDAISEWLYEAKRDMFQPLLEKVDLNLEMLSVFPPVTPVCFASMYSGLAPKDHGIEKYTKPVLSCTTIFDVLSKEGKKCAIVSTAGDSISCIFLERSVDYFIYKTKEECNRKAKELIREDKHDLIVLYNGDYDWAMHRFSPTGKRSIRALGENINTFLEIRKEIETHWKDHRSALAFAPDHGAHRAYGLLGSHGKNIPEDMNIRHFWAFKNA